MKWSELKRASNTILAICPSTARCTKRWFTQELVDKGELAPVWRERMVPGENDAAFADHYPDRDAAVAAANKFNPTLRAALSGLAMDSVDKRSLELMVDKALQAKRRLQDEDTLMLGEALRRHAGDERPNANALKLVPEAERYRLDLAEQLAAMRYLKVAKSLEGRPGVWSARHQAASPAVSFARISPRTDRADAAPGVMGAI